VRVYVTGTDTDVGKTRLCVSLARDRRIAGGSPTIVKLVQTGVGPNETGDAQLAGDLAACPALEFARFPLPADPWSAALAANAAPLEAAVLAARVRAVAGDVIVEGSGGAAVPLNARESLSDVAALAGLDAIVVVGLRLGCISHALMTAEYLRRRNIHVLGAALVERWEPVTDAYREQVRAALAPSLAVIAALRHERSDAAAAAQGSVDWGA
jgi:dethiobiotin synthetase